MNATRRVSPVAVLLGTAAAMLAWTGAATTAHASEPPAAEPAVPSTEPPAPEGPPPSPATPDASPEAAPPSEPTEAGVASADGSEPEPPEVTEQPEVPPAAAGTVTATSPGGDEDGRVRSKWHIGFGLGAQMLSRSNMPATSLNFQVGARLNDHFSLGVDLNAIGNEEAALANALLEGVYFPSKKLGFNVQAGAGVAAAGRIASTTTIYGGFGYAGAVGWDVQVKRRFNIGLSGRVDGLVHTTDRHIWTVGGMLSFTWW